MKTEADCASLVLSLLHVKMTTRTNAELSPNNGPASIELQSMSPTLSIPNGISEPYLTLSSAENHQVMSVSLDSEEDGDEKQHSTNAQTTSKQKQHHKRHKYKSNVSTQSATMDRIDEVFAKIHACVVHWAIGPIYTTNIASNTVNKKKQNFKYNFRINWYFCILYIFSLTHEIGSIIFTLSLADWNMLSLAENDNRSLFPASLIMAASAMFQIHMIIRVTKANNKCSKYSKDSPGERNDVRHGKEVADQDLDRKHASNAKTGVKKELQQTSDDSNRKYIYLRYINISEEYLLNNKLFRSKKFNFKVKCFVYFYILITVVLIFYSTIVLIAGVISRKEPAANYAMLIPWLIFSFPINFTYTMCICNAMWYQYIECKELYIEAGKFYKNISISRSNLKFRQNIVKHCQATAKNLSNWYFDRYLTKYKSIGKIVDHDCRLSCLLSIIFSFVSLWFGVSEIFGSNSFNQISAKGRTGTVLYVMVCFSFFLPIAFLGCQSTYYYYCIKSYINNIIMDLNHIQWQEKQQTIVISSTPNDQMNDGDVKEKEKEKQNEKQKVRDRKQACNGDDKDDDKLRKEWKVALLVCEKGISTKKLWFGFYRYQLSWDGVMKSTILFSLTRLFTYSLQQNLLSNS